MGPPAWGQHGASMGGGLDFEVGNPGFPVGPGIGVKFVGRV
jgi:hypothetical protein